MKRWKQTVKELYGYVLSVVVFVCVLALFVTGILFFQRRPMREARIRCGMPYGELPCSAMPLKADIRPVWIIWRKITGF